jgi:hypothetical protein
VLTARSRIRGRAWRPSARGLPIPTLAAAVALAAAPTLIVILQSGRSHSGALAAAALLLGAMVGYAVEDPAEETLSATPTSLARRRLLRLGTIAVGVALTGVLLVVVAATRTDVAAAELGRRLVELLAASGIAAAVAGSAQRRGANGAAPGAAVTALVGMLLVASLAHRFSQLPTLMSSVHHERWWWVAIAGWAVAGWTWRDPMR